MTPTPELDSALVVAGHGRHVVVETPEGQRLICHPRGKKSQAVVGDRVLWQKTQDEGTIEKVEPRRNLFYRQDEIRSKSFAANLDQVLVLLAADPEFSDMQLTRALVAAEASGIPALIALNKSDLAEPFARAWARLAPYRRMDYTVLPLQLKEKPPAAAADAAPAAALAALQAQLHHKTTLVLGPSGAGKSTLINLLVPGALAQTGEVSRALNSGKHTTTSTSLYWVDATRQTALIDSPGFQEFGLHHITPTQLATCMPDIARHTGQCRFYNCTHLHEPGCGVISAIKSSPSSDGLDSRRYKLYSDLFAELSQSRY